MANKKHDPSEETRASVRAYIRGLEQTDREAVLFRWTWRDNRLQHPSVLGLPGRWPATDANEPEDDDTPPGGDAA